MVRVAFVFFFKQKTAYEMRISDWSSDVCSSDLRVRLPALEFLERVNVRVLAVERSHEAERDLPIGLEIGRASCRERVCQYVWISVVAVSLKTNKRTKNK